MKDDLRSAINIVLTLAEQGQKAEYIGRCDLSPDDADILNRRLVKRQSRQEIATEMHMDVRTVDRHYRRAMLILAAIAEKNQ